jgi:hypothetical protein
MHPVFFPLYKEAVLDRKENEGHDTVFIDPITREEYPYRLCLQPPNVGHPDILIFSVLPLTPKAATPEAVQDIFVDTPPNGLFATLQASEHNGYDTLFSCHEQFDDTVFINLPFPTREHALALRDWLAIAVATQQPQGWDTILVTLFNSRFETLVLDHPDRQFA